MSSTGFKLGKDALTLSILTLITVLVWMAFDIYKALNKITIPQVLQRQTAPLNPKISSTALDGLEQRLTLTAAEIESIPRAAEITPNVLEENTASPTGSSNVILE